MAVTPQDNADFGDLDFGSGEDDVVEEVEAAPEDETPADPETDTSEDEDEGSTEDVPSVDVDELGDHMVTVKVNGKDVKMSLKEALGGVMRQQDYTQKTQEIATERERLASFARLAEALEEDPAGTLKVLQRALGVEGAADLIDEAEDLDPNEARLRRVEAIAEQQEQEVRNRQHIESARNAIRNTEGLEADEGELLQFAIENHVLDLPTAARFLKMEKQSAAKVASKKSQIAEATKAKRAAAVVESGSRRATGTVVPAQGKKLSLREAYEAAKLSSARS